MDTIVTVGIGVLCFLVGGVVGFMLGRARLRPPFRRRRARISTRRNQKRSRLTRGSSSDAETGGPAAHLPEDDDPTPRTDPERQPEPQTGRTDDYEVDADDLTKELTPRVKARPAIEGARDAGYPPGHLKEVEPSEKRIVIPASVTMTDATGAVMNFPLSPGFTWASKDTPSLAVDMHIRALPGGRCLVSTRQTDTRAWLEVDGQRLKLTDIELPWRSGTIVNGALRFNRTADAAAPAIFVSPPRSVTTVRVAATDSCVVLTADQPNLAVLLADMYLPDPPDPLESWRQRLSEYLAHTGQPPAARFFLLGLTGKTELVCAGDLVEEIGLGASSDTIPGTVSPVHASLPRAPWQRRIWLPIDTSEQKWHFGSFAVDLPETSS